MGKLTGITSGTYLTKRIKNPENKNRNKKEICNNCKLQGICKYKDISKFNKGKIFENNVKCNEFYFTITSKAILNLGRDRTTGKMITKTFTEKTEEDAIRKALNEKANIERNGGIKFLAKSDKTIISLAQNIIEEDYKLGKIKDSTLKRKSDTLKKLRQEDFANKPISKVTREDVLDYLETLKSYSKSTIKQIYEILCMAFGQASYEHIITDNFLAGWKRIEKPRSNYKSHHRIALTIDEQKKLIDYLNSITYKECRYKYIYLLLLSTGMRVGEVLVLDYENDIDLANNQIHIKRTQTKDVNGKAIIGEETKTTSGERTLTLNNISRKILEDALTYVLKNDNNLLFCDDDRKMYNETTINSSLKRIALKLNIGIYKEKNKSGKIIEKTDVHTHILRGTFATRCAESKIAPIVLKNILGHSDISVTMKYYIDVDAKFEKSENMNMEKYLKDNDLFGVDFAAEV